MSLWRTLLGLLPLAGLSWNDLQPQSGVPAHDHPFALPDTPTLVQLAEALGGGIYPGMGSGQNDTISAVDSVAPGFPLNMQFLLAANQVKLQVVRLSFQPQAFRTYYSSTLHTHGGDQVGNESLHAHGGDTVSSLSITINNESTNHQHSWHLTNATSGSPVVYNSVTGVIAAGVDGPADIFTGSQVNAVDHVHANVSHTHSPGTTGPGASHAHSPGTTGANNPATGVQEGTSPDSMRVLVDGTDVTTQLGGPWNVAQTEIDVTPYVAPGTGMHIVQVTTTTNLGRIAGFVRYKAIVNSLSAAL